MLRTLMTFSMCLHTSLTLSISHSFTLSLGASVLLSAKQFALMLVTVSTNCGFDVLRNSQCIPLATHSERIEKRSCCVKHPFRFIRFNWPQLFIRNSKQAKLQQNKCWNLLCEFQVYKVKMTSAARFKGIRNDNTIENGPTPMRRLRIIGSDIA